MKAEWFSGFYAKTKDQLIDRLTQALRRLIHRKDENTKTCAIPTELWRMAIRLRISTIFAEWLGILNASESMTLLGGILKPPGICC